MYDQRRDTITKKLAISRSLTVVQGGRVEKEGQVQLEQFKFLSSGSAPIQSLVPRPPPQPQSPESNDKNLGPPAVLGFSLPNCPPNFLVNFIIIHQPQPLL